MSLGDANNNKFKDKTYFSRLNFRDYSHDSRKRINISFWSGMLKISIEKDKNNNGFEYEEVISSYIPQSKAKVFYNELKVFYDLLKAGKIKDSNTGWGIHTGMGDNQKVTCIYKSEEGLPALFIAKVDPQGNYLENDTYVFNSNNYMFGLRITDMSNLKFSNENYEYFELEQLMDLMKNFATHMDGVIAYSTVDLNRYEWNRMTTKINAIGEKNGLDFGENRSGYQRATGNGIFSNNSRAQQGSSNHTDIDAISEKYSLDDDEE